MSQNCDYFSTSIQVPLETYKHFPNLHFLQKNEVEIFNEAFIRVNLSEKYFSLNKIYLKQKKMKFIVN